VITLRSFRAADAAAVQALVLAIQQEEFGLPLTADDQPDLLDVPSHYLRGRGGFWVAVDGTVDAGGGPLSGRIVGTVGLLDIGGGHGALRKMFVAPAARGAGLGVSAALLAAARRHGRDAGVHTLWLGTTDAFQAAHRFYEKHGFTRVPPSALPTGFARMAVDTRFYRCALSVQRGAEATTC